MNIRELIQLCKGYQELGSMISEQGEDIILSHGSLESQNEFALEIYSGWLDDVALIADGDLETQAENFSDLMRRYVKSVEEES